MIPDVRTIEGVFKMFVRTGPGWDDCETYVEVEVDLLVPGRYFLPSFILPQTENLIFTLLATRRAEVEPRTNPRYLRRGEFRLQAR